MDKEVFLIRLYYQNKRKKWSAIVLELLMDSFNGLDQHFFLLESVTTSIFCDYDHRYFDAADYRRSQGADLELKKMGIKEDGAFSVWTDGTLEECWSDHSYNHLFKWSIN
nr:hypothetical protein [Flavobacterium sp. ASV13]